MTSLSRSSSSSETLGTPLCAARAAGTYGSYAMTFMPNADSRCATRIPTRPRPTMPAVFSYSSAPVLAALPLPARSAALPRRCCEPWPAGPDRHLRRTDDVRGRSVHDHHAGLGGRADVHIVQPDAGAGDHVQVAGGGDDLLASTMVALRVEQRVVEGGRQQASRSEPSQ